MFSRVACEYDLPITRIPSKSKNSTISGFHFLRVTSKNPYTSIYRKIDTFLGAFCRIPEQPKIQAYEDSNLLTAMSKTFIFGVFIF